MVVVVVMVQCVLCSGGLVVRRCEKEEAGKREAGCRARRGVLVSLSFFFFFFLLL